MARINEANSERRRENALLAAARNKDLEEITRISTASGVEPLNSIN